MYLYDTNKMDDENAKALGTVRRLLGVMHLLGDKDDWGDVGLFVVMIWINMGRMLIRESLRLGSIGDSFGELTDKAGADSSVRRRGLGGHVHSRGASCSWQAAPSSVGVTYGLS